MKINISETLKNARKAKGYSLDSVQQTLKKEFQIEIDSSNISRYENGKVKTMDAKVLRALCKVYGMDYLKLFKDLGFIDDNITTHKKLPSEPNARILINEEFIDIPVRAKASAGNGYINLDECLYTMRIRKNGYHKDCYLIEVAGTSMSPLIEDGAFVIVDPHQTEYIKDKVYIVNYNEETYVKKVEINQDAGIMILKSVNPNYDSVYIPKGDSHLVKIMGRAVSFFYEGKL